MTNNVAKLREMAEELTSSGDATDKGNEWAAVMVSAADELELLRALLAECRRLVKAHADEEPSRHAGGEITVMRWTDLLARLDAAIVVP